MQECGKEVSHWTLQGRCKSARSWVSETRKGQTPVVTGEEEGLRKKLGGESVCELKSVQRLSDLSDVPSGTVILSSDEISSVTLTLEYGCTVCIWREGVTL